MSRRISDAELPEGARPASHDAEAAPEASKAIALTPQEGRVDLGALSAQTKVQQRPIQPSRALASAPAGGETPGGSLPSETVPASESQTSSSSRKTPPPAAPEGAPPAVHDADAPPDAWKGFALTPQEGRVDLTGLSAQGKAQLRSSRTSHATAPPVESKRRGGLPTVPPAPALPDSGTTTKGASSSRDVALATSEISHPPPTIDAGSASLGTRPRGPKAWASGSSPRLAMPPTFPAAVSGNLMQAEGTWSAGSFAQQYGHTRLPTPPGRGPEGVAGAAMSQASGSEGIPDEEGMGPFGGGGAAQAASLGIATPEPMMIDDRGRPRFSGARGKSNGVTHDWAQARADKLAAQARAASAANRATMTRWDLAELDRRITEHPGAATPEYWADVAEANRLRDETLVALEAEEHAANEEADSAQVRANYAAERIESGGNRERDYEQAQRDLDRILRRQERADARRQAAARRAAQRQERKGRAWRRHRRQRLIEREIRGDRRRERRLGRKLPADAMARWSAAQREVEKLKAELATIEDALDDPRTRASKRRGLQDAKQRKEEKIEELRLDQYWEEHHGFPAAEIDCCDPKYAKCRPPCPPTRPNCVCRRPPDCPEEDKPKPEEPDDPRKPTTPAGGGRHAAEGREPDGASPGVGAPKAGDAPARGAAADSDAAELPEGTLASEGQPRNGVQVRRREAERPDGGRTVARPAETERGSSAEPEAAAGAVGPRPKPRSTSPISGTEGKVRALRGGEPTFGVYWDDQLDPRTDPSPPEEMLVYDSASDEFYLLRADDPDDAEGRNKEILDEIWQESRKAKQDDEYAQVTVGMDGAVLDPLSDAEKLVNTISSKFTSALGLEGESLQTAKLLASFVTDEDVVGFMKSVARGEPDLELGAAAVLAVALGNLDKAKDFARVLKRLDTGKDVEALVGKKGVRELEEKFYDAVVNGLDDAGIRPTRSQLTEIRTRIGENIDDLIGAKSSHYGLGVVTRDAKDAILAPVTLAAGNRGKKVVVNLQGILERQHAVRKEWMIEAGFTTSKSQKGYLSVLVPADVHAGLGRAELDAAKKFPLLATMSVEAKKDVLKLRAGDVYRDMPAAREAATRFIDGLQPR